MDPSRRTGGSVSSGSVSNGSVEWFGGGAMLVRLALRLLLLAVVIGVVAEIVPGIEVNGGFGALLWISVLFSVVNAILGPVFKLLSLPLIVLSLGLFLLVVNAALLGITAGLSSHLDVDGFGTAVLGGLLIAVFSWLAELALPARRRDYRWLRES
jgi:putative membrane protein